MIGLHSSNQTLCCSLVVKVFQETDQITENGTSENTTTGRRSNTQQPDEMRSSSVIQNILTNTENDKDRIQILVL
jgi:hypothetical protein